MLMENTQWPKHVCLSPRSSCQSTATLSLHGLLLTTADVPYETEQVHENRGPWMLANQWFSAFEETTRTPARPTRSLALRAVAVAVLAAVFANPGGACTLLSDEAARAVFSAEGAIICPAEKLPGTAVDAKGLAEGKAVPALTGWRTKWRFSREKAYHPDQAYELYALLKVKKAKADPEDTAFNARIWIATDSRSAVTHSRVPVGRIPDEGWHVWRLGGFVSRAGKGEYVYLDRYRGAKTVWISRFILLPVQQDSAEREYAARTEYMGTSRPGFWLEAAQGKAEASLACRCTHPIRIKAYLRANGSAAPGKLSYTIDSEGRTMQKSMPVTVGENTFTLSPRGKEIRTIRLHCQSGAGAAKLYVLFASPGPEQLFLNDWQIEGENQGTNRAFRDALETTRFTEQRGRLADLSEDRPWVVRTTVSTRKLHPKRLLPEWERAQSPGATMLDLARNEYESFQLVFIPRADGTKSRKLFLTVQEEKPNQSGLQFSFERVGYVYCFAGAYGRLWRGEWPDPLIPVDRGDPVHLAGDRLCVVRVTAHAKTGTKAGDYRFRLVVSEKAGPSETLPVLVRVRSFALPLRSSLRSVFYDYPRQKGAYGSLTDFYRLDPLPPEVCRRWREFTGRYRLTATEYNTDTSKWFIHGYREADGAYGFELDKFRRYAKFMLENCHATCLSLNHDCHGWKLFERFPLTNRKTGKTELVYHKLMSPEYQRLLSAYLKATCAYLKEQGWLRYAYFQISDEQRIGLENRRRLSELIKSVEPELKVLGFNSKSKDSDLDICVYVSTTFDRKEASARAANGGESWWYVCCSPKPRAKGGWVTNYFIDEVGINHRFHFWQAWERGVQGVLYWGLNHWQYGSRGNIPADTSRRWPDLPWVPNPFPDINGDGYLMYPGVDAQPWASMRLAIMRDGLEDYEYFHLLDNMVEAARSRDDAAARSWAERARSLRARLAAAVREQYDSRDKEMIRTWRSKAAEIIEQGMTATGGGI